MPAFGSSSKSRLLTCAPQLQRVFNEVIKHVDCTISEGHRSISRQKALFAQGRTAPGPIVTKVDGVTKIGKHNYSPAKAVDAYLYPVNFNLVSEPIYFAGFVMGVAAQLGIHLRWGGDWDEDEQQADEKFRDFPHFEVD